ncbi:MAG TPA: hypothetical protein VGF13_22930, partial [Verrucomicrobiae bacterium]
MSESAAQGFTAARLAAALGFSRQAVVKQLRGVAATETQFPRGQRAAAWAITALPPALRDALTIKARTLGYRDALTMLQQPPRRFKDEIPPWP